MYLFMKASRVVLRGVWFREEPLTYKLYGIVWKTKYGRSPPPCKQALKYGNDFLTMNLPVYESLLAIIFLLPNPKNV